MHFSCLARVTFSFPCRFLEQHHKAENHQNLEQPCDFYIFQIAWILLHKYYSSKFPTLVAKVYEPANKNFGRTQYKRIYFTFGRVSNIHIRSSVCRDYLQRCTCMYLLLCLYRTSHTYPSL